MTNVKVKRKDVIGDKELSSMILNAAKLPTEYTQLRAKAVLSLLETGKRRSEIASLKLKTGSEQNQESDLWTDNAFLYVRFTVRKKRKKNLIILQRTKKFSLDSQYAKMIQEYLAYLEANMPNAEYLFPRAHCVFGQTWLFDFTKPIEPQEIWRIVKNLNKKDWPHLHRERRAVKTIRADEKKFGSANLETVYRIKRHLDLQTEQSAYNYISRHETQKVEEEEAAL